MRQSESFLCADWLITVFQCYASEIDSMAYKKPLERQVCFIQTALGWLFDVIDVDWLKTRLSVCSASFTVQGVGINNGNESHHRADGYGDPDADPKSG